MISTKLLLLTATACVLAGCQHRPAGQTKSRLSGGAPAQPQVVVHETLGAIERLDPALDLLLAPDATIEKLAEGFDWSEGPVWVREARLLLFSDVPSNTVYSWKAGEGVKVFLRPSGYTGSSSRGGEPGSNGLTRDRKGNLVLCQHGDRCVARLDDKVEGKGQFTVLAQYYKFRRFNSPNDLVYDSRGNLYFTDPPYGLEGLNQSPLKELPFNGVFRLTPEGELTVLTTQLTFPNGLALSPDETKLYVALSDTSAPRIMVFDLRANGTIDLGRVFFDAKPLADQGRKGLPDGLKVDVSGNVFATGPGGVLILSPEGKHLGTLNTGEATANCGWGDDGSTLYITADMYLCRVKTRTKGKLP
jgi:gluconolactonase